MHASENGVFKTASAAWVKDGDAFRKFFPTPQGTITLVISGGGGEYVISGKVTESTGEYSVAGLTVSLSITVDGTTSIVTVITDDDGNYTYPYNSELDFTTTASTTIAGILAVNSSTIATEVIPLGAYIIEWKMSHPKPSSWSGTRYHGFFMTNKPNLNDIISMERNGATYTGRTFVTSSLSNVAGMVDNDAETTSGTLGFSVVALGGAVATSSMKMVTYDNTVKFSYGTEAYPSPYYSYLTRLTALSRLGTDRTNLTAYMMACTSLATVSSGAFAACSNMQILAKLFYGCTALTSDLNQIFPDASYPNVTDVSQIFYGCTKLTGSGLEFIAKFPNVTSTSGALYNCTALSDYASIPEAWK